MSSITLCGSRAQLLAEMEQQDRDDARESAIQAHAYSLLAFEWNPASMANILEALPELPEQLTEEQIRVVSDAIGRNDPAEVGRVLIAGMRAYCERMARQSAESLFDSYRDGDDYLEDIKG